MNRRTCASALCLSAVATSLGCNGGAASAGGAMPVNVRNPATTGRYIPLSVGARWSWDGMDTLTGLSGTTDSIVEALDTLTGNKAGTRAFRIRSTTLRGSTVNWQQDTGTSIVRHREQFLDTSGAVTSDHLFSPSKLRLDESPARIVAGATWTETYTDNVTSTTAGTSPVQSVSVAWSVEAVDEMVTVPAGTFSCLRVHAVETGGAAYDSTFWFSRNIGKVKESGTEIRNLTGYSIP